MYAQDTAMGEWLPQLDIDPPARQRRLTVLLRLLLLIPQFIVLALLAVAAFVVAVIGWFAALGLGRLPDWVADFLSGYLEWATRVDASESLLVDKYPPFAFSAPDYPVRIELHPGKLNRLAVLLRIFLVIPAAIVYAVLTAGWEACSFFIWVIVLIMGRMPEPLFEATAAIARYSMRLQAYWLMLTPAYPKRLFGDGTLRPGAPGDGAPGDGAPARASATRPFLMTTAGRVVLVVFIVIGIVSTVLSGTGSSSDQNNTAGTGTSVTHHH
jgi:hypothetical protein